MKYCKFDNEYIEELFRTITNENKNCFLTGDFNLNHAQTSKITRCK